MSATPPNCVKLLTRRSFAPLTLAFVLLLCVTALLPASALARHVEQTDQPPTTTDKAGFNPASLGFIPNTGQTDKSVRFVKHGLGSVVFFTPGAVVVALPSPSVDAVRRDPSLQSEQPERIEQLKAAIKEPRMVLRTSFVGANQNPTIDGVDQSAETVNYLLGSDPSQWQTELPTFGGVVYQQLYPGIDLHYDTADGTLKSTYIVAAGADPAAIRWQYTGAKAVQADAAGNLVIGLAVPRGLTKEDRSLAEQTPVAWQDINSQRVPVDVRYAVAAAGSAINYSTYFGGTGNNVANDIALNGSKAYVTGSTGSSNLPTKNAYDSSYNGGTVDAYVAGFDTTQSGSSSLLTSSFLGGSNSELGYSIAYESGSLYIAGATLSTNFPMKNAYDSSHNSNYDIFVTKLSATTSGSSALQYSTYLGASGDDQATAIAVKSGNAYITGFTDSSSFPIKYSARITDSDNNIIYSGASYKGSTDALVAAFKTTSSGTSSRLYSTFLGGSGADRGRGIAVEADGRITVVGYTSSTNFPAIDHWPMTSSNNGGLDVFLTKLNPPLTSAGNMSFLNSGYLGGNDADYAYDVAVDGNGRAYITGSTYSTNFPTVNPQQGTYSGGEDVFATKVFPEYTGLRCRWAHTPGVLTTVYYKWGLGLEVKRARYMAHRSIRAWHCKLEQSQ